MMHIWDFIGDLAGAGKGYLEIKETMETKYGDKSLRNDNHDQHHLNGKKTCRPWLSSPLSMPLLKKTTG
jgi:hypothetical protein